MMNEFYKGKFTETEINKITNGIFSLDDFVTIIERDIGKSKNESFV